MPPTKAFFSFTRVTDPARHASYNAWHQLDHRPENLALDGVAYGERWVHAPDCVAAGEVADERLADVHYVNSYWFRAPVEESIREWQALAETSFQWGRRPDVAYSARPLMGFFTPVRGDANAVSSTALPFRPGRGVHVTLWELEEPHSPRTERVFAALDRERLPRVLGLPGVAGAWTFSSDATTLDPGFEAGAGDTTFHALPGNAGRFRLELVFCDGDPVELAPALRADDVPLRRAFAAPLRTIVPYEWSWFS
jgi:hypothetical protein